MYDLLLLNIFSDFGFILKIFFFLFIISFVRQKITHNFFALLLISISIIFLMFFYWEVIGPMYVIYILITIGLSTVLVDFFFVSMGKDPKEMANKGGQGKRAMEARDSAHTAMDVKHNQQTIKNLRKMRPF